MNIRAYVMHQAGPIPGIPGRFSGGQTVYVDMDEMVVVSQSPILSQRPDNETPLVEVVPESAQKAKATKKGTK